MDDIKSTNMALTVHNDTCTSHVTSASNHDDVTGVEFHKVGNFAGFQVELDGVVDFDERIRVTDGSSVMGHDVRYALRSDGHFSHLAELISRFFGCDAVDGEAAFYIVQQAEVFIGLLDADYVCMWIRVGLDAPYRKQSK